MSQLRKRHKSIFQRTSQTAARWFFRVLFTFTFQIRVHGLYHYPDDDRMLICANHQSFLDPLVLGVVCPRPVNYLARKSLFRFRPLGWFLDLNDTIPIDLEGTGIGGMRATMKRLKQNESVIMFPEGTRTSDGEFHSLMLGFCTLATRTKATLLPVGIAGAYQAWSRNQKIPRLGKIHAVMGEPILFEDYQALSNQETADLLESRIRDCFEKARVHLDRDG